MIDREQSLRFSKFAVVGGLGTLVNMLCLWLVVKWLFDGQAQGLNLTLAQLVAIAVATAHNFAWNRFWTWRDRAAPDRDWRTDFVRYACVAALSIGLQLLCVALLRDYVHYLFAAALGIGLASVAAFLLNDRWSFQPIPLARVPGLGVAQVLQAAGTATLAICAYLYAIDSSLIPKNGDENVYLHIARVTGTEVKIPGVVTSSGWLPLKSELNQMRNTKPPLLFFQARAAAEVSKKWEIAVLRLPSLLYTLATAFLIVAIARSLGQGFGVGILAALLWLAFFSTFRFGRPFLTTAPETFWLVAGLLALLRWPIQPAGQVHVGQTSVWALGLGTLLGLGLLHKSFALAAPAGAAYAGIHVYRLWQAGWTLSRSLQFAALAQGAVVSVALGIFALWFVFDPDPRAVWHEFVLGENVGKLGHTQSWLAGFIRGSESIWAYLAAVLMNAGPLVLVTVAAWWLALKGVLGVGIAMPLRARNREVVGLWRQLPEQAVLWIFLAVWVLVFALPSQRSARYVLPAMPALALLLAMYWSRIPSWLIRLNALLIVVLIAVAAALAGLVQHTVNPTILVNWSAWSWSAAGFMLAAVVLWKPRVLTLGLPAAAFVCYLTFAAAFRPLDTGSFAPLAAKRLAEQTVAVPCNFRAKFEEYRFLLPRSNIVGVHESLKASASQLATLYPAFVVRTSPFSFPPLCKDCELMGGRFVFRSRHSSDEIEAMLNGAWAENLLAREWLVRVKRPDGSFVEANRALAGALQEPSARCL